MTDAALRRDRFRYVAAALSFLAALVHMLVTPDHFSEWVWYGIFFFFAATAQAFYAVLLLIQPWKPASHEGIVRPAWIGERAFYRLGVAGHGSIVVFYVITRTVGIPLGPAAGTVEDVGPVDAFSKLIELALIGLLVVLTRRAAGGEPMTSTTAADNPDATRL